MTKAPTANNVGAKGPAQRLDRWLWFARFFKTRTLAASIVTSGKVRVNAERVSRAATLIRPGDTLTFPIGPHIRVIKTVGIGTRRGPAPEAQGLYEDLAPPEKRPQKAETGLKPATREPGSGRPTKRERRQTNALRNDLD
ncbi:MAG: RNA-binding protein S4 [Rhodobiaceae bacterium]|nr:MAG: RNA-binding protein S4 [Rhodobiaceae bacterium]